MSGRLNIGVSCDLMFNDTWVNSWHILIRTGENVTKLFK
jgi:hypothetical protein